MKQLIQASLVICALAAPALSFAQASNGPVTRAEVKADLVRLEQAGYQPSANDPYYPNNIQKAEAKVAASEHSGDNTAVGGSATTGSAQAGAPRPMAATQSTYFGN